MVLFNVWFLDVLSFLTAVKSVSHVVADTDFFDVFNLTPVKYDVYIH